MLAVDDSCIGKSSMDADKVGHQHSYSLATVALLLLYTVYRCTPVSARVSLIKIMHETVKSGASRAGRVHCFDK